jgi:hypothetical protein
MISASYTGLYASHVNVTRNLSALPSQYWSSGLVRDNALTTNLNQNVPNPFYIKNFSALQSSDSLVYQAMAGQPFFTSPTIRKSQLLQPFPQMNGLNQILDPIGEAKAHSFVAAFQRRMSSGFMITFSYQALWERDRDFFYNPFDPLPSWELSNNGAPQRVVGTLMYELPFGRAKPLLKKRIGNALLGGWQVVLTYEAEPGPYVNFGNVFYYGSDLSSITTGPRTLSHWFNTTGFETNPALAPSPFNLRTFPQRVPGLHSNGLNFWTGNIQRNFRLFEGLDFQVRVDFINLLNHTQFSPPGSNPLASDFGQVTTNSATVSRFILFQGKFRF